MGIAAELKAIPLRLVEPHPMAVMRFEYDIEPLAALIKSNVNDDSPNGQLEPGRVVPRDDGKEGYWVYIGLRRYRALKFLYEDKRDERFAVFCAYVDKEEYTPLKLFIRARSENEDAKGERQAFSVLEEIAGMQKINSSIRPENLTLDLRRIYDLSQRLSEKRLRKLYEVERAAGFRFRPGHLRELSKVEDEKEFCLASALTAAVQYREDQTDQAIRHKEVAYGFRWFKDVFPEYEKPPDSRSKEAKVAEKAAEKFPSHERNIFVVKCPSCGAGNLVKFHLEVEATMIPLEPGGEKFNSIPEAVASFSSSCHQCGKDFYTLFAPLDKRRCAVGSSLTNELVLPKETVEVFDLLVNFDQRNSWLKLVVGALPVPLSLPPGKGEKPEAR